MGYKISLLLVLVAISYANAFTSLIPENKELIYHYHGLLTAGTMTPSFGSSFILDGKLHMQTDKNSTFMKFSDLKFKLDNGRYDVWHEFETTEIPLPDDLQDFHRVFQIVYDAEGEAMGIKTESVSEYVLNFQKAIGSMMQLDMKKVNLQSKRPHAFYDTENNVYGKGKAYYNVIPSEDAIKVEKLMVMKGGAVGKYMTSNMQKSHCQRPFDQPMSRDSQRVYNIVKKDSVHVVEELEANGGMYFYPYQGQSIGLHIFVNQSMNLLSMLPIETKLECTAEKFHPDFSYKLTEISKPTASIPDITLGRRKWNLDKLVNEIEEMIVESVKYLKEFHLHMEQPDIKQGQLITRIFRLMMQLKNKDFDKLYGAMMKLKESDKDKQYIQVYLEMLPLIGTKASMEHILKLIQEKKVTEGQGLRMLRNMGPHAKVVTKDIIEEMANLMDWGEDFSMSMRRAGMFCFTTLLMKATQRERMLSKHEHKTEYFGLSSDMTEEEKIMHPDTKFYEKYILEIVKRMKETEDHNMRLLYIQALSNTKFESVLKHLTPIIKGQLWDDHYLRLVAALLVKSMVVKNEELAFELYWPMVTDVKLPLSTRICIYYLIMELNPSLSTLINIHWHMQNELENVMYQFHYTYLKNKSEGVDSCNMEFRLRLKQLLRYTPRPHFHGLTSFNRIDYYQTKYGYSQSVEWAYIHSGKTKDTERIFKISFRNEFNGLKTKVYTVFMRIIGIEESLLDRLRLQINETPSHIFSFKDLTLKTLMKELQENENFKMNLILIKHDQIVMDMNIGHKNFNDLFTLMGTFMEEQMSSVHKFIHVNLDVSRTVFLPSEIGFPATYQRHIPSVYYYDWSFKKETVNNIVTYKIDAKIKIWASGIIGFSVYNPIADIWHGVNRYHSYDAQYPLVMDITINPEQESAKFSFKRHGKHEENTMGLKSHVATLVFVKDDLENNILQKCSPKTKNFIMVSNGDEYRKDTTIYEYDNSNTGYKSSLKAFYSERYIAENSIKYFHHLSEFKTLKQYRTLIGDYVLNFLSAMTYSHIQPEPETNGFLYRFEPSKKFPVTQNDLTLKKSIQYKQGEWILLPEAKINIKANYVLKNEEKTIKTWDINMLVGMDLGHTFRIFLLEIARMIPGEKDYRICLESNKKWLESTTETRLTLAAGEDKCDKAYYFMEVDSVGEQLEDQKLHKHNYAECLDRIWSDIHEQQSMRCYAIQSSIRKYTYNIRMHEVPAEFSNFFDYILDGMKAQFRSKLTHSKNSTVKLEKDNVKVVIEYPMMSETYGDVTMYTPSSKYKLVSVPIYHWLNVVQLDNLHYNKLYKFMYSMGLMNTCFVTQDFLTPFDGEVHFMNMTSEYTLYKGDSLELCKNGVLAKKIEGTDKIAVKFVHKDHSLEIVPESDDHYEILLDGKKMDEVSHSEEWMYYNLNKETRVMNILMHRLGGHYLFDGHSLQMDLPKIDMDLFGACIKA